MKTSRGAAAAPEAVAGVCHASSPVPTSVATPATNSLRFQSLLCSFDIVTSSVSSKESGLYSHKQGICSSNHLHLLGRSASGVSGSKGSDGDKIMEYPQFTLTGQVALVTGAARGLGRAISLALANAGADVALGLRDVKADSGLAAEILKMGRRALPLQMDMTKLDQVQSAVDKTAKEFGRIDILVNNAGIAPENLAEDVLEKD